MPEPAETYSTSEHLYTDLEIPRDAKGTLPDGMRGDRAGLEAEAMEDIGETGKTRSRSSRSSRSRTEGGARRRRRTSSGTAAAPLEEATAAAADKPARTRRRRRTRAGRELGTEGTAELGKAS
jgi:hypothetical protein